MSTELFIEVQKKFHNQITSSKLEIAAIFRVKEEAALSSKFIPLDAPLFRSLWRARRVSEYLITDQSSLSSEKIKKILPLLEEGKGLKYLDGFFDEIALNHMIACLEALIVKPKLITMINTQKAPVANTHVQRIILRATGEKKLNNLTVQRALLSAYLTPLRQNVGSCFATAPCILIQREQPENFFTDITTLISTGKLTRVIEGREFAVPISLSGGIGITKKPIASILHKPILKYLGVRPYYSDNVQRTLDEHLKKCKATLHMKEQLVDLTDHALLKAWEFTIASFSDFKIEIYKWNLYASLGFDKDEPGGIGHLLYKHLDIRLKASNEELEKIQGEYEHAYMRVKMTESLLRGADSEEKARRIKAEHASNVDHFYACQEKRDELQNSTQHYAQFFSFLLETYSSYLPTYFQELYDADMVEANQMLFEDAPAGFRLLFKHGRSDPSAWTFIYSEKLFIDALESFFRMTEREVIEACTWKKGKKEIETITTKLLYHVRTEEFIQSAFQRIRKFHAKYGIESHQFKTPWSYVSGGTISHLLRSYYIRMKEFSQEGATVNSWLELLTMYLDLFKELPPKITSQFDANKRMIATSPNHVFTLIPGSQDFAKAWDNRLFTYTWIRDELLLPGQMFYRDLVVTQETLHLLWLYIGGKQPRSAFQSSIPLSDVPSYFAAPKQKIDGLLRSFFPLVPKELMPKQIKWPFDVFPYSLAHQLLGEKLLEENGFFQPKTLLIGDTNWSTYFFSFVVNPTTWELELWRTDQYGISGQPMSEWTSILHQPTRPWTLFWDTKEYGQSHISSIDENLKKV